MLEDLDAGGCGGPRQAEGELRRVHQRRGAGVPDAGEVGGGVHLGAYRGLVEEQRVLAVGALAHPLHLMRLDGEVDGAVALELGVDAELGEGGLDLVEVRQPELLQPVELLREAADAVLVAVGEAGLAEAAVAAGRRPADRLRLEQHDARRPGRSRLASSAVQSPV